MSQFRKMAVLLAAAVAVPAAFAPVPAHAQERLAVPDVIYYNGRIYTGVSGQFVTAVAVKDGKVLLAGDDATVRALAGANTRQEDLQKRFAMPGLYDNHVGVHGADPGLPAPPGLHDVKNLGDLQKQLKDFAATLPKGAWIGGLVPHAQGGVEPFPEGSLPTRQDLDAAVPDHPVALHRGGHVMLANTMALREAGIVKGIAQPAGGVIELDKDGEPTGIIRSGPAHKLLTSKFPKGFTDEAGMAVVRDDLKKQLTLGVTSVNIPSMPPGNELRLVQKLYAAEGTALPRATVQVRLDPGSSGDPAKIQKAIADLDSLSVYTGFGNDRIKLGAIKMAVDGAFGAQAAWVTQDYKGRPGYRGTITTPPATLYPIVKHAHDLGWQVGIHAIGDQAVVEMVDIFDRVLKENPRPNARHFLHHISVKPPERTLKLMEEDGILAAMQPNLTYTVAEYYDKALEGERLATNNPEASLLKHNIKMSIGSDGLPDGPFIGIYAAVTRRGVNGKVYGPEEKLTVEQAIYNATVGTAYLTFDEKTRGTLEPGKVADLIVLDRDIFKIDPEQILNIKVLETVIGGDVLYRAPAGAAAVRTPEQIAALAEHDHAH